MESRWKSGTRRGFLGGVAAAITGFVPLGYAVLSPSAAFAVGCHQGDVYCRLNRTEEYCGQTYCVYHCYDKDTLDYCWSYQEAC